MPWLIPSLMSYAIQMLVYQMDVFFLHCSTSNLTVWNSGNRSSRHYLFSPYWNPNFSWNLLLLLLYLQSWRAYQWRLLLNWSQNMPENNAPSSGCEWCEGWNEGSIKRGVMLHYVGDCFFFFCFFSPVFYCTSVFSVFVFCKSSF